MCHKLILLMLVDRKGCVILLFLNRLDFLKSDNKGNRIRSDELKKRFDRCSVYFPLITDESTSEGAHLIFVNEPKVKNDLCVNQGSGVWIFDQITCTVLHQN